MTRYQNRFPPEVTHDHLSPLIRWVTGEINRTERRIVNDCESVRRSVTNAMNNTTNGIGGQSIGSAAIHLSEISGHLAARDALYGVLGELLGSQNNWNEFIQRYPARGPLEPEG